MARIRTVKPDFWTSEKLAGVSRDARLLFIGMWNFADDEGVMPAKLGTLKAQVFPLDVLDLQTLRAWVDELIEVRSVVEYQAVIQGEERPFWWVRGLREHQVINRPSKSKYPLPPENSVSTHGVLSEGSVSAHGVLTESSVSAHGVLSEDSLREGKGREGSFLGGVSTTVDHSVNVKTVSGAPEFSEDSLSTHGGLTESSVNTHGALTEGSRRTHGALTEYPDWFEELWKAYPKRSGSNPKVDAWKAAQARLKEGHAEEELQKGVARYAAWAVAADKVGTEHVMQAATFFGPSCRFLEPYDLPRRPAGGANAAADAAMAMLTGNVPPPNFDDGPIFDGQAERLDDQGDDDAFLLEG